MTVASNIGGDGLDDVFDVGGSLTFDDSRRGRGMAVRHEVGYRGNAYYGWDDSFSWSPTGSAASISGSTRSPRGACAWSVRAATRPSDSRSTSCRAVASSVRDSLNRSIETMSEEILTDGWVRVEWMVEPSHRFGRGAAVQQPEHAHPDGHDRPAQRSVDRLRFGRGPDRTVRMTAGLLLCSGPTTRLSARSDTPARPEPIRAREARQRTAAGPRARTEAARPRSAGTPLCSGQRS